METAPRDSSLYRACLRLKAEANSKWPMGLTPGQTSDALADMGKVVSNWAVTWQAGKLYVTASTAAQASATAGAGAVTEAMIQQGIYLGDGTAATSVQSVTAEIAGKNTQISGIGSAAQVVLGWSAGNAIGKLATWNTGEMKKAEEKLVYLYILNNEIEQCMRNELDKDGDSALDITALYLTSQEVGLETSANYFISYGRSKYEISIPNGMLS